MLCFERFCSHSCCYPESNQYMAGLYLLVQDLEDLFFFLLLCPSVWPPFPLPLNNRTPRMFQKCEFKPYNFLISINLAHRGTLWKKGDLVAFKWRIHYCITVYIGQIRLHQVASALHPPPQPSLPSSFSAGKRSMKEGSVRVREVRTVKCKFCS